MAQKQWKLEVDLKTQAEQVIAKAENFKDQHLNQAKLGLEKNQPLVKHFNDIVSEIREISKLINLGSGRDMRAINSKYRDLALALEALTKATGELTEEQIKASEKVNEADKILDAARDRKKNLTKGKVKIGDGYGLTIQGFSDLYEKEFRKKTEGLNQRKNAKNTTIKYETFLKKMQDEKWASANKDIVNSFNSWRNSIIKSITEEIEKAKQDVDNAAAAKKIAQQEARQIDRKTPTGTEYSNVVESIYGAKEELQTQLQSKHDFKLAQNTEENDEKIQALTASITKQQTALGKAFKQFTLYAVALRTAKKAVRMAIDTIGELDKSLTEQAMVTGKTREETYGLLKSYQDLAAQVGSTTKEVASVATEYMKQGETVENALVLTKAAVSAAKVARVSVGDSVNYLTTALKGFHMEAEQAMTVSDKFAKLAAASATDYDELAIALSKVASQAHNAGMSMDYTLALLTKGLETTRKYFAA